MSLPTLATAGGRTFTAGFPGQVADSEPSQVPSATNTAATAIEPGRVIVRDTADRSCKVMAADGDTILGIAVRNPLTPASTDGNNTVNFAQYQSVPYIIDGVVFCLAAENVRADDQALALTAGGGTIGGSQGGVAGSGRIDIPGAKWLDTTASGAIGRVRIKGVGTRRTTT